MRDVPTSPILKTDGLTFEEALSVVSDLEAEKYVATTFWIEEELEDCPVCGRPTATEADWNFYAEGEGEHLCWDGEDAGCVEADVPALMGRIRSLEAGLHDVRMLLEGYLAYKGNDHDPLNAVALLERLGELEERT